MKHLKSLILLAILLLAVACSGASPDVENPPEQATTIPASATIPAATEAPVATTIPASPTIASPSSTVAPSETAAPSPTTAAPIATVPAPTATEEVAAPLDDRPDEAILIQQPGPGSRVTSPLRVAGIANPTFEQNLIVRVVLIEDGTEILMQPTTIGSDVGTRGPFSIDLPFTITGEQNALIQVFADSPRDGAITHLSSVGVILSDSGPANLTAAPSSEERIAIFEPAQGTTVSGGIVHVEGYALASFEQTLVADLLDADGNTLARQPITVNAPDLGQPGPFNADIPYSVTGSAPARVVVRDPSVAFSGTVHLTSVEITLAP